MLALVQIADGSSLGEAAIGAASVTFVAGISGALGVAVFGAALLSLKWVAERLQRAVTRRRLRSSSY